MLFLKECKKVICSLTFVLYTLVVIAMHFTQFGPDLEEPITRPQVGAEGYGTKTEEVPEVIMPAATDSLISEYLDGKYSAYPFMFYKEVKLKEKDTAKIAAIIEELSGLTRQELDNFEGYEQGGYFGETDENGEQVMYYREAVLPEYELSENLTYERFQELMQQADEIIGGGSKYAKKNLLNYFSEVQMTYEDAVVWYEELMQGDNLTEAYFRLLCDYTGIDLAIIPVFVCVALWQMDKRSRMEALVYSRKISSFKLLLTRYAALIFCMTVPLLLTVLHSVVRITGLYPDMNLSFGGALGLTALWLLPSITAVTALGALLTELISPLISIFVQGVWWIMALDMNELKGSITKWTLLIRHNTLGGETLFQTQYADFLWNRTFYLVLSLVLFLLTVLVYEWKRKGNSLKSGCIKAKQVLSEQ